MEQVIASAPDCHKGIYQTIFFVYLFLQFQLTVGFYVLVNIKDALVSIAKTLIELRVQLAKLTGEQEEEHLH